MDTSLFHFCHATHIVLKGELNSLIVDRGHKTVLVALFLHVLAVIVLEQVFGVQRQRAAHQVARGAHRLLTNADNPDMIVLQAESERAKACNVPSRGRLSRRHPCSK